MTDRTGTPAGPPAGWYQDPSGQGALRWWDGSRWGEQTQPGYQAEQPQQGLWQARNRPPQGLYPQQPGKSWPRRHKVLTTLGIIAGFFILLTVIAGIAGGGSTASNNLAGTSSGNQSAAAAPAAPHLGQPADDGKFRFVVTQVTYVTSVGDASAGLGKTAQGRYTVLHVRVTNIGNQSQTLDDSAQFVYDKSGRKFSADTQADLYANPGGSGGVFLNDINPGNSVRGLILFDMPRGDKAVKAELHDSLFSGGVVVYLTH
jgi:hypothetical protein